MENKEKKLVVVLMILTIVFTVMGGTLAYFNWQSTTEQKTNVTFTVAQGFSCGANGGGNLTSNDIQLAPAHCTNTTYAIKRTITVHPTITQANTNVYLDMWLKVNSIGSGLASSQNFKYALTTSSSNCLTDIVTKGNFYGATANTQKILLSNKEYSTTTTETYYLWIWLDAVESNPATQNQSFNIEIGGNCTDEHPTTYNGSLYMNARGSIPIKVGDSVSSLLNKWWIITNDSYGYLYDSSLSFDTESACNQYLSTNGMTSSYICQYNYVILSETEALANSDIPFLKINVIDNTISELYFAFTITSAMAQNFSGTTAGTYYLQVDTTNANNDQESPYFYDNKELLQLAFGSTYCYISAWEHTCSLSSMEYDYPIIHASTQNTGHVEVAGSGSTNDAYCRTYWGSQSTECSFGYWGL